MPLYTLDQVGFAPAAPGVYAWHAQVRLTPAAIKDVLTRLRSQDDNAPHATRVLAEHLEYMLWAPSAMYPYTARLQGELAPRWTGLLEQQGEDFLQWAEKLLADDTSLERFNQVLAEVSASFLPSLYIGKAENLRSRLQQHRMAIVEDRYESDLGPIEIEEMRRFAGEVRRRSIRHDLLRVDCLETPGLAPDKLEFILNRLTYPVLGRR